MSAEELLSRTVKQIPPSYAGVYSGDAHRVEEIVTRLEDVADTLRAMSYDLGLEGEAADAGTAAFEQVRLKLLDRAEAATQAAATARRAYEHLMEARAAYNELPPAEIDDGLRNRLMSGGTIRVGGIDMTGTAAVGYLNYQYRSRREAAARRALDRLSSQMQVAKDELPVVEDYFPDKPTPDPGGNTGGGRDRTGGGSGRPPSGGTVPAPGGGRIVPVPGSDDPEEGWVPPPAYGIDPNPIVPLPYPKDINVDGPGDGGWVGLDPVEPGTPRRPGLGGGWNGGIGGPGWSGGGGSYGGSNPIGGAGGALAGGAAIGGTALGAAGLLRGGLGALGGLGGAAGAAGAAGAGAGGLIPGAFGGAGGAGAGGAAAGARGASGIGMVPGAAGGAAGTGAGGAAGRGSMMGMPMGGAGAAGGGKEKGKRSGSHYMAPDVEVEEEAGRVPLGPGAKAGSRDELPQTAAMDAEEDLDEDW